MKHTCHAVDCEVPVSPRLLFCPRHWRMTPPAERQAVLTNYRAGQECDMRPSHAYLFAMQDAINAVARLEGKPETHFAEPLRKMVQGGKP